METSRCLLMMVKRCICTNLILFVTVSFFLPQTWAASEATLCSELNQNPAGAFTLDQASFNTLLLVHRHALRRFALSLKRHREDAEDLVQQTFVNALKSASQFQPDTNMEGWLLKIMMNLHLNDVDKEKRRHRLGPPICLDDASHLLVTQPGQCATIELKQVLKHSSLSFEHRQILFLIGVKGYSYEEAAELLGVAPGTIRSRLSRARDKLENVLNE